MSNDAAVEDASLDKVLDKMAKASSEAGPSKKKEVTYAEFQAMLDSTPLFMRETPEDDEDNEVLQALKTLVFDGEGDGGFPPPALRDALDLRGQAC